MNDVPEHLSTPIPVKPLMVFILQASALEARVEDALRDYNLSIRKVGLLGHLRSSPGISFSDLARRAGIRVQSLQPIAASMIDDRLIQPVGGVGQGRAAMLQLTEKGQAALRLANEIISTLERNVFKNEEWAPLEEPLAALGRSEFEKLRDNAKPA